MNVQELGSRQQQNGSQLFERARTEALLNAPSQQATRRADRLLDYPAGNQARFAFSALRRHAQRGLQLSAQLSHVTGRLQRAAAFSQPEAIDHAPFASFVAEFVAANRVTDARALLAAVPMDQRLKGDLRAWLVALAEPKARSRVEAVPDDDRSDLEWLRRHASDYAGRWVAIRRGALVAAAESLRDVLRIVDSSGSRESVLVHKL